MSEEGTHKGLKDTAVEAWERGKESLNQAKQKSEQTIHEHPFESVGIAFAVGIVVGVLIGRR